MSEKMTCPNCSKMEMVSYLVTNPTIREGVSDLIKSLGEAGKLHQGSVCVNCGKVIITDRHSKLHHFQISL